MITIMTYNICSGLGLDNIRSIDRAIDVICRSGADIICLQEVDQCTDRSLSIDQPAAIAEALGAKYAFQGNLRLDRGWYGIAIVSKFDVIDIEHHFLTSVDEPRGLLQTSIQTSDGTFSVFCTHFGLLPHERSRQAEEASDIIRAAGKPKVVCGDFNEQADCAGVSHLIASASLIDSDPNGHPTFDSAAPEVRIDMILHTPDVRVDSVRVIDTQASDHLPLLADISLDW